LRHNSLLGNGSPGASSNLGSAGKHSRPGAGVPATRRASGTYVHRQFRDPGSIPRSGDVRFHMAFCAAQVVLRWVQSPRPRRATCCVAEETTHLVDDSPERKLSDVMPHRSAGMHTRSRLAVATPGPARSGRAPLQPGAGRAIIEKAGPETEATIKCSKP